jgi:2'-5' RNA ligase
MSVDELRDLSARREGRALRAFFAWALPEAARAEIADQARALRTRPKGDAVRWVRSEGYHVTLRFLGNVARPLVPELVEVPIRPAAPVIITPSGIAEDSWRMRRKWGAVLAAL